MDREKEPVVLTVDEVAGILRISRASAYEACRRGDIPTLKIGRRVLVPRKGLDRLIAGDGAVSLRSV
jgi:excisionase family DNA binding protein